METRAPFVVGGHLALDFLNSVAAPRGEPIEFLANGIALLRWLEGVGVISARDARRLAGRSSATTLDRVRRDAVALREWFRRLLQRAATMGSASIRAADLGRLNAVLARGSVFQQVDRHGTRYVLREARRWCAPADLLVPLAEAMADLLCTADFRLVRKCDNAACTLWFYDRTKAHRRRWCAMAICGNRLKVAAHRRRARRSVART